MQEIIAYHEAAHATLNAWLDFGFTATDMLVRELGVYASIEGATHAAGHTSSPPEMEMWLQTHHESQDSRGRLTLYAIVAAGGIASDVYMGLPVGSMSHRGDLACVYAVAEELGLEKPQVAEFRDDAIRKARQILLDENEQPRAAWEALAAELLTHEALTGEQVRAIIEAHPLPDSKPPS